MITYLTLFIWRFFDARNQIFQSFELQFSQLHSVFADHITSFTLRRTTNASFEISLSKMWKGAFFVRTFLISALSWNGSFNSFVRFCHDATTVVLFVEITERTDEENKEAAHSITERRRPYVILRTGRKFLSSGLLLPTSPYGATGQRGKTQSTLWHLQRAGKLRP